MTWINNVNINKYYYIYIVNYLTKLKNEINYKKN